MRSINFENVERDQLIHIWEDTPHILVSFEDTKTLQYYKTIDDVVNGLWSQGYKKTAREMQFLQITRKGNK